MVGPLQIVIFQNTLKALVSDVENKNLPHQAVIGSHKTTKVG